MFNEDPGRKMETRHWTSQAPEILPDNGKRYEIIDGELYVSRQPHYHHQLVCSRLITALNIWSSATDAGEVTGSPGLIFAEDDDVVPDAIWISRERQARALQADGKLHAAPELVIEVLSPGTVNEYRDREIKLKLYSRRGVLEYWVVSWQARSVEVYRREETILELAATLYEGEILQSPHLPGFAYSLRNLFSYM
jgi:Uma2 family endonuclease